MRTTRSGCAFALTISLATLPACGASRVPRLEHQAVNALDPSEQAWAKEADKAEKSMGERGDFVEDPAMQAYLDDMLSRLLVAFSATAQPVRIRIVRPPIVNAISFANGLIVIDAEFVALLDNGAQLAAVVGHELEHHLDRHALRREKEKTSQQTMSFFAAAPLMLLGFVELGAMAADGMSDSMAVGYSKNQEVAADSAGLRAALAAGYDMRQAPIYMETLIAYQQEEGIHDSPQDRTHPPAAQRLTIRLEQLAAIQAEGTSIEKGSTDEQGYLAAMAPALLVGAQTFLDHRRLARAQTTVDRYLSVRPHDARGWLLKGDVLRRRAGGKGGALDGAAVAYDKATQLDPGLATAWRELGLLRRAQGRDAEARDCFRRYLSLAPDAKDRGIVQKWI